MVADDAALRLCMQIEQYQRLNVERLCKIVAKSSNKVVRRLGPD